MIIEKVESSEFGLSRWAATVNLKCAECGFALNEAINVPPDIVHGISGEERAMQWILKQAKQRKGTLCPKCGHGLSAKEI